MFSIKIRLKNGICPVFSAVSKVLLYLPVSITPAIMTILSITLAIVISVTSAIAVVS